MVDPAPHSDSGFDSGVVAVFRAGATSNLSEPGPFKHTARVPW
jgi:hypothetical protein